MTNTMQHGESDIRSRLLAARLPAMPQILLKLLEQCQSDVAGMAELADLIAKDPGISSKIIAVANSSAYHRVGSKVGLEQALASIGTDMVKTLVISESVFQIFNNFSCANGIDLRRFWKHSLAAAVIARDIAARMHYPHVEEAYFAGLLHDIGRLALLAACPAEYRASFLAADDAGLCALEQRILQVTHAEAGAWLVEHWYLDSFLADSVLYHHESLERIANAHPLIRIVQLAHLLSHQEAESQETINAGMLCGIDAHALVSISEHAVDAVREAADQLGIDLDGADDPLPVIVPPPSDPTRERLSEEVRNLVLTANASRTFARRQSEDELRETVIRSARILFGFDDAILLQMNAVTQSLTGCAIGPHRQRLAEFSLSLDTGTGASANSPIVLAATRMRPAYVKRDGTLIGLGEEQLLRMFGTAAMVALPLLNDGRCTGVLVGALSEPQLQELLQRERFLQAFAAQASSALRAAGNERAEASEQLASVAQEYREASRRVAHEVNNPLAIIKNYLAILDAKLLRQEPVLGEMSILNEEIDRVGQIVNTLADLQPTAQAASQGATNVNQVAGGVVHLFEKAGFVPPAVRITTRLQDQPDGIAAPADTIKQIMMNLLKNAVEAMPRGGDIEVVNKGHLNRDGRLYVELSIRDTGAGIPPDILATLFTPGRSTKQGANRGQGLAIVHQLVKQIGGMILCRSSKSGTSFDVLLPIPEAGTAAGKNNEKKTRGSSNGISSYGTGDAGSRVLAKRSQMMDSL